MDVIAAVGYRVNSKQATQFLIWATKVLKEFIIKGFVSFILKHFYYIRNRIVSQIPFLP
jgi:hypothetical protein